MSGVFVGREAELARIGRVLDTRSGAAVIVGDPAALAAAAVIGPTAAFAHPHVVSTSGHLLANGQNHGPFVSGVSCGGDPAANGLETAHHGPDAGTPGRADGCYQTTGSVAPVRDVASPVIR